MTSDPFAALSTLETSAGSYSYFRLARLADLGIADVSRLPFSIKILLENLLRHCGELAVTREDVEQLARWSPESAGQREIAFLPARVLLQDFTGIPVVADLAALRAGIHRQGGDASRVNPAIPVDLIIDHSVQVDAFGTAGAFRHNVDREYERNRERYTFLRWAQRTFANLRVVPPGAGIVHQVNLEYLAPVVQTRLVNDKPLAFPDTLVGTDSHTTMINGLGVLGWGVGGIEAEAAMLQQPLPLLAPEVIGVRFTGSLREGVTATDLVLTITQLLRQRGVVGKFVEFCGPGLSQLALADRATIANMAPEYGATMGYFPIDSETIRFLERTGRETDLVEAYARAQGLFREDSTPDPVFTDLLSVELADIEPSLAGPRRPQDRVPLAAVRQSLRSAFAEQFAAPRKTVEVTMDGQNAQLSHGSVAIAAITSCTNTSNPSVMIGAGLLARNAVERGLTVAPYVKTSLAPGSRVVMEYLERAGLLPFLEQLGFNLVGFGCTTCIGNSGPLPDAVAQAVTDNSLVVAAVLSGNRNFEGRIHPQVRASYLASPPLVVAFALAGNVDIDMTTEPLGHDRAGQPVYLADIWPSGAEINETIERSLSPELFRHTYAHIFDGDESWQSLPAAADGLYEWDPDSTYLREPPFVQDVLPEPQPLADILSARALALLGDSVTTDHISPAGAIAADSPAAAYLREHGVIPRDFNSYGSRRGNHEVMMRGTFANVRLRNELLPGVEGGWTEHIPSGEKLSIYDAAMRYSAEGTPLVVIAGKEYGAGSSRDWAAKGVALQGVRAVIAESYERIHRSNLMGMGVLPLEFLPGQSRLTLGISGRETFDIAGLGAGIMPRQEITVRMRREDGSVSEFRTVARVDTLVEMEQYRNGGILPLILRHLLK